MDAFALTRPLTRMRRPPLWDGRHFLGKGSERAEEGA